MRPNIADRLVKHNQALPVRGTLDSREFLVDEQKYGYFNSFDKVGIYVFKRDAFI